VDERNIKQLEAKDLAGFTQCHFFAGIGVWSYALRLAGWPDSRPVWTGSCPCPSFSAAGKGGGFDDPRHLWPAWFRLIRECRPATVFGEQVDAAIGHGWLDLVQTDLEGEAYSVGKAVLGACSAGAPHKRQRLYFVAESGSIGARHVAARMGAAKQSAESEQSSAPREAKNAFNNGATVGLADTELSDWGAEYGEHRDAHRRDGLGRSDEAGELGDAASSRRQVAREHDGGPPRFAARSEQSGFTGKLEHADERRHEDRRPKGDAEMGRPSADGRGIADIRPAAQESSAGIGGMALSDGGESSDGELQRGGEQRFQQEDGFTRGFWRDAEWLWCRDGKWRPVESGTFPLAHGTSGRVGKLRGFGNAICAPVAQAFIRAYIDARELT